MRKCVSVRNDDAFQGECLEGGGQNGISVPGRLDVFIFGRMRSGLEPGGMVVVLVAKNSKQAAILEMDDIEPVEQPTALQREQGRDISYVDAFDRHSKGTIPPRSSLTHIPLLSATDNAPFGRTWGSSK